MPDINKIAASSYYDSFKNYTPTLTGTVNISGTVSGVAGSNFQIYSTSIDLGRDNPSTQVYMTSNVTGTDRYSLSGGYQPTRSGTLPLVVPYNVALTFQYSGNSIICQATIINPYATTMTVQSETITFYVSPFIAPY